MLVFRRAHAVIQTQKRIGNDSWKLEFEVLVLLKYIGMLRHYLSLSNFVFSEIAAGLGWLPLTFHDPGRTFQLQFPAPRTSFQHLQPLINLFKWLLPFAGICYWQRFKIALSLPREKEFFLNSFVLWAAQIK